MKWISVKDRLPEADGFRFIKVLVVRETLNIDVLEAKFNTKTSKFQQTNFERLDSITYWMPLPDPPKDSQSK